VHVFSQANSPLPGLALPLSYNQRLFNPTLAFAGAGVGVPGVFDELESANELAPSGDWRS